MEFAMSEQKGIPVSLNTMQDALALVMALDHSSDCFSLISGNGRYRINAHSLLGLAILIPHKNERFFLINDTHQDIYPPSFQAF